jgi:hypothetical protein
VCFLGFFWEGAFTIGRAKHCATQKRTWCLPEPSASSLPRWTPHQQDTESRASVEEPPPAVSPQAVLVASAPNCSFQVLVPR